MTFSVTIVALLASTIIYASSQETYCGWPGKPWNGRVRLSLLDDRAVGTDLNPEDKFTPGSVVSYRCHTGRMDLLQGEPTRMCQSDGRWTGERPWCDINVAFGKPVKYSGITETTTEVLTDGLSDSNDPMKTAECPVLAKSNPFFEIDLLDSYPIHFVAIYGKDGTIGNMLVKTLKMDTINCVERNMNKTSLLYGCARENDRIDPQAAVGRRVRFEHTDPFSVAICEVVVYVNPGLADCGEPEVPANGRVTITNSTNYQEARYECDPGYDISGISIRQCYGRKWNGYQPLCIENNSPTTPQTNSTTVPNNSDDGSMSRTTLEIVLIFVSLTLIKALVFSIICWLCNRYNWCPRLRCKKEKKSLEDGEEQLPAKNKKTLSWKTSASNSKVNPPLETAVLLASPPPTGVSPSGDIAAPTSKPTNPPVEQHTETEVADPNQTIYANVILNDQLQQNTAEMTRVEPSSMRSPPISYSPIYSKMIEAREKKALSIPSSPVPSVTEGVEEAEEHLTGAEGDEGSFASSGSSVRKSYIPRQYRNASLEQQRHQQLLNDHLKDVLKKKEPQTSSHETDF